MSLIGITQYFVLLFILFLCVTDISKVKRNFILITNYLKKKLK